MDHELWIGTIAGGFLILLGAILFVRTPRAGGGRARLKVPFIEAELPVGSLVPMVLGTGLLGGSLWLRPDNSKAEVAGAETVNSTTGTSQTGSIDLGRYQETSSRSMLDPPMACVSADRVPLVELKWAPSDCGESEVGIGIDGCVERRPLPWLRSALGTLRDAKVRGFSTLPRDLDLRTEAYAGKEDWLLRAVGSDGRPSYNVFIGYNITSGAKDGCLSLGNATKALSPSACMDRSGTWWIRQGIELCPVPRH
jgi:hypothetical protein